MTPNDPTTPAADNDSPKSPRLAAARAWWSEAWDEDGILYESGVPTGSLSGPSLMLSQLSR
ncbi:hypothetical protein ACFWMT_19800 [Streptomyces sp. NPDC058368]|uniref:hypothetical protein n=1 Tax=Streptomyces sp. NPDC058368 TaxID=3346461 RepID=UPI0036665A7E